MTTQEIFDSIYIIPVLLEHFDEPTDTTRAILKANNINDVQVENMRKTLHLLQYHKQCIETNFKPDYPLLRIGLVEYFEKHLSSFFLRLGFSGRRILMLDYGCGAGQWSDQFLKDNPESAVVRVDKEAGDNIIKIDFEKEPYWTSPYHNKFNLILLSEVLHCKEQKVQKYLINSSCDMLKRGGQLLIVENNDPCMEFRISHIKGKRHRLVTQRDITILTKDLFILDSKITLNNHTAYLYAKI